MTRLVLYISFFWYCPETKEQFQCERFEKKQCFALMVLNWFSICFY